MHRSGDFLFLLSVRIDKNQGLQQGEDEENSLKSRHFLSKMLPFYKVLRPNFLIQILFY